jgi:phenylpropionate dioxygenase-like ring-hydroxylating dioxygenase large terminal subunit
VHGEVLIKANHWMVIENVIDMAHVPYVHKGTVGNHAAFVDIIIERLPNAMNFSFPIENHHADGEEAAFRVDTKATACLPSTSFIRFTFPFNLRLVTINSVVPIDEEHTCIRFCQMRNFMRCGLFDPIIYKCARVAMHCVTEGLSVSGM